eukprot:GFUD01136572.1.p1 GENE.GFUD01136572.1~~GFUD01136572.1.p1  ORF type:complete len:119 (-),score=23.59 GFUD01136572.1:121-435(-)
MASYSCSFSSSSSSSSSQDSRSMRATSELSDRMFNAMKVDRNRFEREFYTPEPISRTGNYYPRYKITGSMETGTQHVSYLSRPYYSYKTPSRYGFSKFITVRKM